MSWWAASLIANIAIIYTEYLNRNHVGSWAGALPKTIIPIIVAQYCLFRAWNGAPHWMIAWAFFTIGNSLVRVSAVGYTGSEITSYPHIILGVSVMVGGAFLMKSGLR